MVSKILPLLQKKNSGSAVWSIRTFKSLEVLLFDPLNSCHKQDPSIRRSPINPEVTDWPAQQALLLQTASRAATSRSTCRRVQVAHHFPSPERIATATHQHLLGLFKWLKFLSHFVGQWIIHHRCLSHLCSPLRLSQKILIRFCDSRVLLVILCISQPHKMVSSPPHSQIMSKRSTTSSRQPNKPYLLPWFSYLIRCPLDIGF